MILLIEFILYVISVAVLLAIAWDCFFTKRWERKTKEMEEFLAQSVGTPVENEESKGESGLSK